ncbi:MAG TPA: hypothetical protein VFA85_15260 [Terriglobales bacterium]|nr:hypothetical protein [Terriglobales bacterium]
MLNANHTSDIGKGRDYALALLSASASLLIAFFLPTIIMMFRYARAEKATGLAAVAGGFLESLFSPWFWVLFLLFFSGFYFAGHARERVTRIFLCWIPTTVVSFLGFALWGIYLYLMRTRLR